MPPKEINILDWWKCHENVLPLLAKLAKRVLTVPASSAKSERVFSTGGNFVTAKRNSIGVKKVEDLIVIKENKTQIQNFKTKGSYNLRKVPNIFDNISVDIKLANLAIDENDVFNVSFSDDEIVFVNDNSDTDSESESDIEEI